MEFGLQVAAKVISTFEFPITRFAEIYLRWLGFSDFDDLRATTVERFVNVLHLVPVVLDVQFLEYVRAFFEEFPQRLSV